MDQQRARLTRDLCAQMRRLQYERASAVLRMPYEVKLRVFWWKVKKTVRRWVRG